MWFVDFFKGFEAIDNFNLVIEVEFSMFKKDRDGFDFVQLKLMVCTE